MTGRSSMCSTPAARSASRRRLVSDTQRDDFVAKIADEYEAVRVARANKGAERAAAARRGARQRRSRPTWRSSRPRRRSRACTSSTTGTWPTCATISTGRRSSAPGSWRAIIPAILDDEVVGESARVAVRRRAGDARQDHRREMADRARRRRAVAVRARRGRRVVAPRATGPPISAQFDAQLADDESHVRLPFLRQQIAKREGRANMCLADFIDPAGDWIGGFAVGIHGIEPHLARFKADDRRLFGHPAEGAGRPPRRGVRRAAAPACPHDAVGLCRGRAADQRGADQEQYRGIRPAPGYPACPDHSLKPILFELLDAHRRDRASR